MNDKEEKKGFYVETRRGRFSGNNSKPFPTMPPKVIDLPPFKIYQEAAGVISKGKCWVCIAEDYLYTGDSFKKLIHILNTEWKRPHHYVGALRDFINAKQIKA